LTRAAKVSLHDGRQHRRRTGIGVVAAENASVTIRDRLNRLDERTGAASFGRFASVVGGYWCLFVGVIGIALGIVNSIQHKPDAFPALAMGSFIIGIGLFVGPRHMFRRAFRRRGR